MESLAKSEANTFDVNEMAAEILNIVFEYRRTPNSLICCGRKCGSCQAPHLKKMEAAIEFSRPVTFVLPAFPGKSPNLSKVLGPLPDMAERLALLSLQHLSERIEEIYPPGAQIILCSDGRVFSDIVGMRENDVTDYQHELERMIDELGLTQISTFNLDEFCENGDFTQTRRQLMEEFGAPFESLRDKVLRGLKLHAHPEDEEAHRMYCGITRFLVEDATFPGQIKSRSAIQRECKAKAYEVIRRSNAWSKIIAERFPEAVRLSIHPQVCGSKKLGIRLVGNENWMTPWHGVAVRNGDEFLLMKRTEAEVLGARLILSADGRPSYFDLPGDAKFEVLNRKPEAQK